LLPCEVRSHGGWCQAELNDIRDNEEGELPILLEAVVVTHLRHHLVPLLQVNRCEQAPMGLENRSFVKRQTHTY
jgi:hypothetical protein